MMEFNIHLRDARQLFIRPVENLFADNHHVCFLHSNADIVAGEVLRAEGQFFQVFAAPVLRRRQKMFDKTLAFVEGRHIDENLAFKSAKERLVDFPAKKVSRKKCFAKVKLTNQGMLVDPSTKTFSFSALSSPSSSERNSFFNRFEASCSVELRFAVKLSNSSMKIIDGAWYLASSNSTRISFSDSPRHFEIRELAAMLKNVNVS